jgi:uncharacterized membrane protein
MCDQRPVWGVGAARSAVLVGAVCVVVLVGGGVAKLSCTGERLGPWYQRGVCYSDINRLYSLRGIDRGTFPYVHARLVHGQGVHGFNEYPVLTGLFMWLVGRVVAGTTAYVAASMVLLGMCGLAIAAMLVRVAGTRALLWAAAPMLFLAGLQNWDLLAVAASVAGFLAWAKGQWRLAAVWFGVGAAFKLYPTLFLLPLSLDRARHGDRRGALSVLVVGVLTEAGFNLPFVVINPSGWLTNYRFQALRPPNPTSIWTHGLPALPVATLDLLVAVLTGISVIAVLGTGWVVARRAREYPFLQVCAATLAIVLVWAKVASPQYALWLLPLFVLVGVRVRWWLALCLADTAVYIGFLGTDTTLLGVHTSHALLTLGVWARAGILTALAGTFLHAKTVPDLAPRT